MDRYPDAAGGAHWEGLLTTGGWSRENLFAAFVHSEEFGVRCRDAGIQQGTYMPPPMSRLFVYRLYETALDRKPDEPGLLGWTDILESGRLSGAQMAYEFMFCEEIRLRNLNNGQFVDALYKAMLGRDADAGGRVLWTGELDRGVSRVNLFRSFVDSAEFKAICRDFGINIGTFTAR